MVPTRPFWHEDAVEWERPPHRSRLIGVALVIRVAPTNVPGMSTTGALTGVSTRLLRVPIAARIIGTQKMRVEHGLHIPKVMGVKQEESYA